MGLSPDQLGAGFVGLVVILGALGKYLQSLKAAPAVKATDPVLAGIGVAFGEKEQTERLISEVHGCRVALEILADRRTEEIEEMHREVLDRLDKTEGQAPRRRR